jgi:hypothetical protein
MKGKESPCIEVVRHPQTSLVKLSLAIFQTVSLEKLSSRKFAWPRSNTCESPWLSEASLKGIIETYRDFPDLLLIPSSCTLPHGWGRAI